MSQSKIAQPKKYRHNWSERDYIELFKVCRTYKDDTHRVNKLLELFSNNRENGLRMMIEKYNFLSGDGAREFFREGNISKRMLVAWKKYN
jgi:hypothetical protein